MKPSARISTSALVYPVLTVGSAWLMAIALDRGWPSLATLVAIQTGSTMIVAGLELVLPHRRDWLRSHGDVRTDIAHLLISTNLVSGMILGLGAGTSALLGPLEIGVWPVAWSLPAQLVLVGVIQSFMGYWVHRAQHLIPLLWRVHAIHHSAPRVYWLNQWRGHPLEGLVNGIAVIPVAVMGATPEVLAVFTAFNAAHLVLQHSNIEMRFGLLNWILSTSEAHRWHHSREPRESNTNYGGLLLVWDVVFRTAYLPDRPSPEAGLPERFPQGYLGQLAAPFRAALWRRS